MNHSIRFQKKCDCVLEVDSHGLEMLLHLCIFGVSNISDMRVFHRLYFET